MFQVYRVNFSKTFAPTIKRESLRIYLALCLKLNLFIYQVNIMGIYLESLLGDNKLLIIIKLSAGYITFTKYKKAFFIDCRGVYIAWNNLENYTFNQNLILSYKRIGFVQLNKDPSIFIKYLENKTNIMSVYIDNFLLASDKMNIFEVLKKSLSKEYNIKNLKEVKTIIG